MKKKLFTAIFLTLGMAFMNGCDPEKGLVEPGDGLSVSQSQDQKISEGCELISFDTPVISGFVSQVFTTVNSGPVKVRGQRRARKSDGSLYYRDENLAMIFDSAKPTGNDPDLGTPNQAFGGSGIGDGGSSGPYANTAALGKVLIMNRDNQPIPNDHEDGGKLTLDFSSLGTLTLNSITIIDNEEGFKVILYGAANNVLKTIVIPKTGDNGVAKVSLGSTAGVVKMEVILGPENALKGSGAIDNIEFCRKSRGCTHSYGYWKTHSKYGGAPYDATWAKLGEDTPFFSSGKTHYEAMWTSPQGNAYYTLAHQYITTKLNILLGVSLPPIPLKAYNDATALFEATKGDNIGDRKRKFLDLASILGQYNVGRLGPGSCK